MTTVVAVSCKQPGCKVAEGGKCVEAFDDPTKCPHYGDGKSKELPASPKGTTRPTSPGLALTVDQANAFLVKCGAKLIVPAGAHSSGKTTLITSIFESFHKGPFASYSFAGSETLYGFEERCYLNRPDFAATRAHTPRTSQNNPNIFLHLRLQRAPFNSIPQDLLLADFSGESFKEAQDHPDALASLPGLERADHFSVLLDGATLKAADSRHATFVNARQLLSTCLLQKAIGNHTHVELIVTKMDLWHQDTAAMEFIDDQLARLITGIKNGVASTASFKIAARPEVPGLKFGHGVDALLERWANTVVKRPVLDGAETIEDTLRKLAYGSQA